MTLLQTTPLQQLTEQIADWRSTELEVDSPNAGRLGNGTAAGS